MKLLGKGNAISTRLSECSSLREFELLGVYYACISIF